MSSPTDITPWQLRKAARWALRLGALLDKAAEDGVMPIYMGFDLDWLAGRFEEAADRLEESNV